MPSHSSSRGNFSSGGSRGGGFSFGGGHSHGGGGSFRPRRPLHFHFFGSPVVISTGAQSGFLGGIILFIIALFISIICFGTTSNNKATVEKYNRIYAEIQEDSRVHLDIIKKAEAKVEGYDFLTATFDPKPVDEYDYYYDNRVDNKVAGAYEYITDLFGQPRYYVIYEFSFTLNGKQVEGKGETFAQFFSGDLLHRNGKIEIAYHIEKVKTGNGEDDYEYKVVDSINRDYTEENNFELYEAQEVIKDAESSLKVVRIISYVAAGIAVFTAVILILSFVRTVKKSKEEKQEEAEEKEFEREQILDAKKKKYCVHCGSQVDDNTKKCPSCGSSKFERK